MTSGPDAGGGLERGQDGAVAVGDAALGGQASLGLVPTKTAPARMLSVAVASLSHDRPRSMPNTT